MPIFQIHCCEKCWGDAYMRSLDDPYKDQAEHYTDLLNERKDNPCTPREQAGQWWNEEKQCDERWEVSHERANTPESKSGKDND